MFTVEPFGRAEIHGDTVLHDLVLCQDQVKDLQRSPAINHEIFGDDFEPVAGRLARKDVLVVRDAEADTHSIRGETVKAIRGH